MVIMIWQDSKTFKRVTAAPFAGAVLAALLLAALLGVPCSVRAAAASPATADSRRVDFARQVRPILAENCFACHGPDESKRKSGLRLDHAEDVFKAAKSGAIPVMPRDPAKSEVMRRVTTDDADDVMPPKKTGKHLAPEQVELLRRWIAEGAEWKGHWAYSKPERPARPVVSNPRWARAGLDYFVLERLDREHLRPSPEASPETLIRRLSLDLTGLPPTLAEVDAFLNDHRSDAYERLVEHYLASPHYGERWARPWLDQARYADSNGYEADNRRSIWPYRDWVIKAFNDDLPFDEFTIEQLAGDLLPNATREQKIATGFQRNTMVNTEGGTDEEEFRTAAIVDRVNTTFNVWMGSTLGCAQCHTHKYDPFTQKEYYQVFAIFNQTRDKGRSNDPEMDLPTPAQQAERDRIKAKVEPLQKILDTQTPELDARQANWEAEARAHEKAVTNGWVTIPPGSMRATDGVTLTALPDGSILAGGETPPTAVYEISAVTPATNFTAIRLEALVDERLPSHGSGRSEDGDFVLTDFSVEATPGGNAKPETPTLGPWYSLGPIPAEAPPAAFKTEFAPEKPIDLARTYDDGKLRWQEQQPSATGGATEPLAGEHAVTYLYRSIQASERGPVMVSYASGDELRVWLNGESALERDATEGGATNRAALRLELAKGQNQLLVRVKHAAAGGRLTLALSDDQSGAKTVSFASAYADFSMEKYEVKDAIDNRAQSGWSIAAYEASNRVDRQAVFVMKRPSGFEHGMSLALRLKQESTREKHLLGRFRLSVSAAPKEDHLAWGKLPERTRTLLQIPATKKCDEEKKELAAYYRSIDHELDPTRAEIAKLRKEEPKGIPTTLVMEAVEKWRTNHVLIRGSFLNPGDEVFPGVPAALHPWPKGEPVNRLTFARWLVDTNNPLVGRVTMNRIWAQYFGIGLVETSEDFGVQGELPANPDLLDWLACEFVRQGWSLKAMHRIICNSATYRQTSRVTPELAQRDPYNRLLARGPRFRMEAEMLRDNALTISGLLDGKIGGPSVFPYQPGGVWSSPYNQDAWTISQHGGQFRRGLYTFWRRTAPYASFMAFDAPSREVVCERRARSNTPVQALVTLNDTAFFAAANALAQRVLTEGGATPRDRATFAFRCCLARRPTALESRHLLALYERSLRRFQKNPTDAAALVALGLPWNGAKDKAPELAAWAVVANVLLNLDETLTKG